MKMVAAKQRRNYRRGFSLVELLCTLVLTAMVVVTVLGILHHTSDQAEAINWEMSKLALVHHGLERILTDIEAAGLGGNKIDVAVETESSTGHASSQLTIKSLDEDKKSRPVSQIDWVAVPSFEEELVLYRREKQRGQKGPFLYVPVCENLYSFQVDILDPNGQPSEDPSANLVEITAEVYRAGTLDPDRVIPVRRTHCINRF